MEHESEMPVLAEYEESIQAHYGNVNREPVTNKSKGVKIMAEETIKNVFATTPAMGGGYGGGGDGMGGLLALALLGGGLGGRREDNCVAATTALNVAGFDGINHNINTSMLGLTGQLTQGFTNQNGLDVMAKLGTIEGAIPLAEAQVQLAIAGSTASINQNIANGLTAAIVGQTGINKNISDAIAASLASQSAIKETVLASAAANLTATLNAKFELAATVRDDGDKTRALIVAQNDATLNRELAVAQSALLESRAIGRAREVEVNVTQTVNQNQAQAQAQFQQQQQFQVLANLSATVANLANDIQVVRQGQTIFNSGTMAASGTQAAANTKVN